jgi:hypothetical protein
VQPLPGARCTTGRMEVEVTPKPVDRLEIRTSDGMEAAELTRKVRMVTSCKRKRFQGEGRRVQG